MAIIHKTLTHKKWFKLSLFEQMANVGSDVFRAISWKKKEPGYSQHAFERALELLDFTLDDPKNRTSARLKELCRLREALVDYFAGDNEYGSSDELWQKYFMAFNYAARRNT